MENKIFIPMSIDLQLLAEGGAGGASGSAASGDSGANATVAAPQNTGENTAPLNKGEQTPNPEVKNTREDRKARYDAFIKEHKDLDDVRVQSILKGRLKSSKDSAERYESLVPTLELLAKKYGVDPTDTKALAKAIDEDDSYYEQEAYEKGLSVEQLKAVKKIEKENTALKKEKEERERREAADKAERMRRSYAKATYDGWIQQEKDARAVYPSLDLRTELKNPKFAELLKSNIDVKTAYEVIHKDDIIAGAMYHTAKTVEQKIADDIIANGKRPMENGNSSQGATSTKANPSAMTKAERADLNRRVLRGERVDFK